MTYQVGQILPLDRTRGMTGEKLPKPVWHALTVPPGREAQAALMLQENDIHASYPTRESRSRQWGKIVTRTLPVITQVIYAQFREAPNWDVIRRRRLITGVYSVGNQPIAIPYPVIRQIQGLDVALEALERAKEDMLRIRAGDSAEIMEGPLAGFTVDVTRVAGGRAWFQTVTGIKGSANVGDMRKDATSCD